MTSLAAGNAICDCKNPDTCTHRVDITLGDKKFSYIQEKFSPAIYMVVEDDQPIPLTIKSISKGCASSNSQCPIGDIYDDNVFQHIARFSPAQPYKGKITYQLPAGGFSLEENNPLRFLVKFISPDNWSAGLAKSSYFIRVTECAGEPFVPQKINIHNEIKNIFVGKNPVFYTAINLVLLEKFEVDVFFGLKQAIEEFNDEQRRQTFRENYPNRARPGSRYEKRLTRKYTTPYEVTNTLTITGKISSTRGKETRKWSKELEQEYKKGTYKLSLLESVGNSVKQVNKVLSDGKKPDEIKLLSAEILYPVINLHGEGALCQSATNQLYFKRKGSIKAAPLFGIALRLDVIQMFANYYKLDMLVATIREHGQEREQEVKRGKDGAYLGVQLDLIVKGSIDLSFSWASDEKKEWHFEPGALVKGSLAIGAETNIRGGVRYWAVEGYFKASAEIMAEVCVALDNSRKDKLDLVFYHEGIKAKASVGYSARVGGEKDNNNNNKFESSESTTMRNSQDEYEKEWVLHEPLPKEKSKFRVSLG
ncbi:hypothetical protein [Photorhabdus heterorhabditis]|uniref:hypothetical protein n=1 Tax=Photorhabdus heterorhabditis TaxID=880156 RepID=UPI0015623960|nr:hypothetical protein [Photorhabdus heterorhabditis]NRN27652.1 hypothetical protein [Photorhabdus heterorhabditis subsp. aluminescens]